jgi:D-glycero-D-manno-heptose 1,7-bisphosphate phosphatase
MIRPAIFLDRDGVINRNRSDHVKSWSEFEFLPGTLEALRRLTQLGWPVVVISNQAVVGHGLVSRQTVEEINAHMVAVVQSVGGRIDQVLYCPHRPEEGCDCRKPRPGLLLRAADRLGLDLSRSFFVGDAESDVRAAQAVGCRPVLVKTGRGVGHMTLLRQNNVMGYYLADDLTDAVNWILGPGWMTKFYSLNNQLPDIGLGRLNTASSNFPWFVGHPN